MFLYFSFVMLLVSLFTGAGMLLSDDDGSFGSDPETLAVQTDDGFSVACCDPGLPPPPPPPPPTHR